MPKQPPPAVPQVQSSLPLPKPSAPERKCKLYQKGLASWYGHELAGNRTASGEMFKPDGISTAHPKLPFGTILHVKLDDLSRGGNPEGVFVRVNDRGPFVHGRIIDLSWGAAKKLGMMDTQRVHVYRCS
ncbi:MAG: septal ring lytic transglycosylase RlpA family protein [Alphaproteobacteria bacterium]|nr:septal ring lytic transglycosylase RlpA family protein [Alphaproteobacteria bacterium]MCD8526304.1 septal ring lytic transglycosylase RlpA family protein [Alphaproteobacteria bacterium]